MKNKFWLTCILIAAAINLYWFWPGRLYFLNDDLLHIPLTDQGHYFQTNSIRPLHELLVRLDLFLWAKNAYGYHITALLLHLIVCFPLYNLCLLMQLKWLKMERKQATEAALLAVFLFLIYPQSSETIAWIIGRAPILSAVFLMITLQHFFNGNYTRTSYVAGAFFFAAALFAYEQSVLLPAAFFLFAFQQKETLKKREMLVYSSLLSAVAIVYVAVRGLVTSEIIGTYEGGNLLSYNWQVLAANAFRLFFRLFLNPANKIAFVVSVLCFLSVVAIVVFLSKKVLLNKKLLGFFVAAIILLIIPVLSLGIAVNSYESGRYLYLPSIILIMSLSITGIAVFHQKRTLQKLMAIFLVFLAGYWLWGKYTAARNYTAASSYVKLVEDSVQQHFKHTADTMFIDTLRVTVNRLPVFRLGFKTGTYWLDNSIDTNKIVVKNYLDESVDLNRKRSF